MKRKPDDEDVEDDVNGVAGKNLHIDQVKKVSLSLAVIPSGDREIGVEKQARQGFPTFFPPSLAGFI